MLTWISALEGDSRSRSTHNGGNLATLTLKESLENPELRVLLSNDDNLVDLVVSEIVLEKGKTVLAVHIHELADRLVLLFAFKSLDCIHVDKGQLLEWGVMEIKTLDQGLGQIHQEQRNREPLTSGRD
jgi:hypothetical protein